MCEKACARRDTHSLNISIEHPERTYKIDKSHRRLSLCVKKIEHSVQFRAEAYEKVDDTGQEKAQSHDFLLAEPVHKNTIGKS